MSVALAEILPAIDLEDTITINERPYLWSDLLSRRNALGLKIEDLVPVLQVDLTKYRSRETGALDVGVEVVDELIAMEEFVAEEARRLVAAAPATGTVTLLADGHQASFQDAYPNARTFRDNVPYPVSLQYTAIGRAAAELGRQGRDVAVYRGVQRADLMVRRLAAGLLKEETARLLDIDGKKYSKFERSTNAPPAGLLAELQAVDDFIDATAADMTVVDLDGVSIVSLIDDQDEFARVYPHARTLRDGTAYHRRVLRVAAVRRAEAITAAGGTARIAVDR